MNHSSLYSIKQQQQAEYQTSALGQSTSSDEVVKAAQDYMTAKNAMDVETQKYNLGMENDLQAATENANNAMEAYAKVADKNGNPLETDLKNLDPQKLEDQLLGVTDKDLKVKVGADTSDAENDIQSLENLSGSTLEVQCDVSNEDSLEQAKSAIESMPPNTTATVDVEVDGKDDVQNVIDLMQSAPTDGSEFVLNCDVQNADDLKAIQAAANELNKTQGTIYKIGYDEAKELLNTNVYSFRYNDDGQPANGKEHAAVNRYGFVLEDMEKTFPMAVEYDENGLPAAWCVQIIVPTILEIVKHQQAEISSLKAENKELKEKISEIDKLKKSLDELRELITNK